jgi:hypothetical protein
VQFGSPDDLPVDERLVFFLKSSSPAYFPRNEKVEVAASDSSFHTTLDLADGSLMLEDSKTAVGRVEPLSRFGSSAFGPIRVRAIAADGSTGDWLPLGTLVRVPEFKELRCPRATSKPCVLSGNNLFLADSIASTPDFGNPTAVPPEFTGTQIIVPHPAAGLLYLKLRDDPATVQTLTLPVVPVTLPAEAAAIKSQPGATPAPASLESSQTQPSSELAPEQSSPSASTPKQQPAPSSAPAPADTPEPPHAIAAPVPASGAPPAKAQPAAAQAASTPPKADSAKSSP